MRVSTRTLLAALLLAPLLAVVGPGEGGGGGEPAAAACNIGAPNGTYAGRTALSPAHARVWRLYQAFFLRQPDENGFDYWISVRSGGATLPDIAYQFSNGTEFQNRYGNLSHQEFVDLAYANILCRAPDAEGRAYWTALLASGELTRWDMMINFAELREYLGRTGTCHSIYPAESAAVDGCDDGARADLSVADLGVDGYRQRSISYGGGTIEAVEVDATRNVFETGVDRCSVASINGNWLVASEKDAPNPGVLGVGVVDGIQAKGSSDRSDRGIFGLRFDQQPQAVIEVWPGDTLSDDDTRLNSVMYQGEHAVLEQWHAAAELSPYLAELAPDQIVEKTEWVWAAAGIPLIVDGQTDADFSSDYSNDPYTYQTLRHPFVAFDQDTARLLFGATATLDVRDLVDWANANGYEDLIKFDGGGSAEFNVNGHAVVAGTSRDVPVWLGIGC